MSGSFSQQSTAAASRLPFSRARSSAALSTTSPRELLMSSRQRPRFSRNLLSARWNVRSMPSRFSGVWKVMMSAVRAISSSDTKLPPSARWRGGSHSNTLKPKLRAQRTMIFPTLPTPTTPSVSPRGDIGLPSIQWAIVANTYCATAGALQPGALRTVIPFSRQ